MKDVKGFLQFFWRVVFVHTISYFIFGIIMANIFNYKAIFQLEPIVSFMKPIDSGFVFAGPFLQPIRGLIFAIGLWPLRQFIFDKRNGWLLIWGIFVVFGIFGSPAAAPCSLEGIIYSKLPLWYHLLGLPEILLQTLCFSVGLFVWERPKDIKAIKASHLMAMQIIRAIVISCFAYIGYAIGSLLCLGISIINSQSSINEITATSTMNVKLETAAGDLKIQLMFIVALIVNICCVYFVSWRKTQKSSPTWLIFIFFLTVDTFMSFIYQWSILGGAPPFYQSILIGFFPAVIISLSLRK